MKLGFDERSMDSYRQFLALKSLPQYAWDGEFAVFPDEYASRICGHEVKASSLPYSANPKLFDYQRDIAEMALRKKKFAAFVDCGLGKTFILLDYAVNVFGRTGG